MSVSPQELDRFLADLVAQPELWAHLVRHGSDVRVYEQIWDDEDVNAWVICWSEDQDTGFHDHDESSAAVAVVSGQVYEDRLCLSGPSPGRTIGPGETFAVPPEAIHRVLHAGEGPAVTIHAYSPPLARSGAYRVSTNGELRREVLSIEEELRGEPCSEPVPAASR